LPFRWQLSLRVRPPRSRINPGGFDGERHALLRGLAGNASVRDSNSTRQLRPAHGLPAWRERTSAAIARQIAHPSARFIQAFAKIGLVPDAGGSWSLPHLLGEARAKALALTAEPLPAPQAAEWGLIWKAVPDDALMDEARALARSLAAGPTRGLGLTKRLIQAAATNSLDEQLDLERDAQREAGRSRDYAEGVAAFLDKRPAVFRGE